jgi:CheY-like chemotaxis protein
MFLTTTARVPVLARRIALVVEDDPRLQKSMRKQLTRGGFSVLSAYHYDAAICHLALHKPHVVCIDVGLPSKSGYELCEYIRGPLGLKRVPIIMTSENGHSEDMAFAEAAGGNAFLRKPFSNLQLAHCVASLLDRTSSSVPPVHELARFAPNAIPVGNLREAVPPWVSHFSPDGHARSGRASATTIRVPLQPLVLAEATPTLAVVRPLWPRARGDGTLLADRARLPSDPAEVPWVPLGQAG